MLRILVLGVVFWSVSLTPLSAPVSAQGAGFGADPTQVHVRLVTFGPGRAIHQYFGHNALWLHDAATGRSALYNYGMFSFGADMLPKYLKGQLTFWVEATPVLPTFEHYKRMNRSITVQELDLDAAATAKIVAHLLHDVKPANRFYSYHHYNDNCSTRLRDAIDIAVGGGLAKALSTPSTLTYRDHTRRYSQHDSIVHMALLFWMNDEVDVALRRWEETFLPLELASALDRFTYLAADGTETRLVGRTYDLFKSDHPGVPAQPADNAFGFLLFGLAAGSWLVAVAWLWARSGHVLARVVFGVSQAAVGGSFGLLGLLGTLMWFFTEHGVTFANENQFLANGLTFLWLPFGLMTAFGSERSVGWSRWLAYGTVALGVVGIAAKLLPNFNQGNLLPLLTVFPINLGLAGAHAIVSRAGAGDRHAAQSASTSSLSGARG